MAASYSVVELATAVKPFLLRALLDGGMSDVTYLDPDIEVFADLSDIANSVASALQARLQKLPRVIDGIVFVCRRQSNLR